MARTISDLQREEFFKPTKLVYLHNPLDNDFTVSMDIHENGEPVEFTIPALDSAGFEPKVAEHVRKHLVDAVLNVRSYKNHEIAFREVSEEVTISI